MKTLFLNFVKALTRRLQRKTRFTLNFHRKKTKTIVAFLDFVDGQHKKRFDQIINYKKQFQKQFPVLGTNFWCTSFNRLYNFQRSWLKLSFKSCLKFHGFQKVISIYFSTKLHTKILVCRILLFQNVLNLVVYYEFSFCFNHFVFP